MPSWEVDAKVELIRSLVPLGLMHVEELLDAEVTALAGERYARKDASVGGRRHGSNPGTVGLAGQRVPIRVPRLRHVAGSEIPLRSYEALHGDRAVNDRLLTRVLYGDFVPQRRSGRRSDSRGDRAVGVNGVPDLHSSECGRSSASSRSETCPGEDVVALVLDGKTFAEATMVVALGITLTGEKRFLGFVETDTENAQVLTPFLRSLVERGPRPLAGGAGGSSTAARGCGRRSGRRSRHRALVQRCQWHKARERGELPGQERAGLMAAAPPTCL